MCQNDSDYIIPFHTHIHSSETRSANACTSISWMQNCPITSPYRRCAFYADVFENAHATKLYGGFYYKTTRGHITRLHSGGTGFEFCGGSGLLPRSLTTRVHGGRGKQLWCRLPRRFIPYKSRELLIALGERAMEILLQDCTGARMLPNCTANFFDYKTVCGHTHTHTHTHAIENFTAAFFIITRLTRGHTTRLHGGRRRARGFDLFDHQTARGQPPRWRLLFFPRRKTIILNIIITLLHSLRLRSLLLQTPQVTRSSF